MHVHMWVPMCMCVCECLLCDHLCGCIYMCACVFMCVCSCIYVRVYTCVQVSRTEAPVLCPWQLGLARYPPPSALWGYSILAQAPPAKSGSGLGYRSTWRCRLHWAGGVLPHVSTWASACNGWLQCPRPPAADTRGRPQPRPALRLRPGLLVWPDPVVLYVCKCSPGRRCTGASTCPWRHWERRPEDDPAVRRWSACPLLCTRWRTVMTS